MKRLIRCVALALLAVSCGSSPAPTTVTTSTTTTTIPALVSLTGTVSALGGARLSGATVRISDGANAGASTTTDGSGAYRFDNLTRSNANVFASAPNYDTTGSGLFLDGTRALNFTLRTTQPFTRTGSGANVFDLPTYITRVRIVGDYNGSCENFIIHIAGRGVVNEILGTCSVGSGRHFEGTYVTSGGVVEVLNSSGITWTFTEVR